MSKLRVEEVEDLVSGRSLAVEDLAQTFDYKAGIKITSYSQMVRDDNGEFWQVKGTKELPYTTTGAGMPEGGAFVSVGDAVLRQDLVQPVATYNSVADMQADTKLAVGRKARTLGYYTPGDGGGNDYEIVAAGTGTADGGSFIDLTGISGQAKGLFLSGYYSAGQFGAVGDGVSDDAPAMQSMASAARAGKFGIFEPAGKTYRVLSTVDFRYLQVKFLSRITSPDGVLALSLGGNAAIRNNPPQVIYSVQWDDPGYWKVATSPQVLIRGMKGQSITIENCDYVQFYQSGDTGPDYSSAYSYYKGVFNKFVQIDSGDGTGGAVDGWFNENELHFTSVLYFEITEKNYSHNNNRIYGGTFEGNGKGDGVVQRLGHCSNNKFSDMRYERSPKVVLSPLSKNNTIEFTWRSAVPTSPVNVEDNGSWNVVYNSQDNGRTLTPLLNVTSKNLFTFPDGSNHLNGLSNLSISGAFVSAPGFTSIYTSDLISAKECPELGAFIQNVQSGGIRVNITAYDENLNVINSTDEDYRQIGTGVQHSFQPEDGGISYPSLNNSSGAVMFVNQTGSAKAAYVRLNVRTGKDGVTFGSLNAFVRTATSGLYLHSIAGGKNTGVPCPATQRPATLIQSFTPLLSADSVAGHAVNIQVFTYEGVGIVKGMPCSCAPDPDTVNSMPGLVFEAYASSVDEITVRITNATTDPISVVSGTRPRITVFPQYVENA